MGVGVGGDGGGGGGGGVDGRHFDEKIIKKITFLEVVGRKRPQLD